MGGHAHLPTLLAIAVLMRPWVGGDAAPLKPDWTTCAPPKQAPTYNCCTLPDLMQRGGPLVYKQLAEYLRENPLPKRARVRPAAHLVASNRTYLEQLNRGYQLIRELPATDPRSLAQQINLHCMYGSLTQQIVMQLGFPDCEYTVHRNWLFWPFHRWYTFFFERIVAKLVGDDDFVMPFWNWDNQSPELAGDGQAFLANVVPHFYRDPQKYPALFDSKRHPRFAPGNPDYLVDLSTGFSLPTDDWEGIRRSNNQRLHAFMLHTVPSTIRLPGGNTHTRRRGEEEASAATAGAAFLSAPIHAGDSTDQMLTAGLLPQSTFEYQLHGAIHGWLGDPGQENKDMGNVWSSVNDALFMAHHANGDRLWALWQSLGGQGYHHPDFLDAAFFFYDENAELVRVTVADALDHRNLMLDWQHVQNPWLSPTFAPTS